MTIYSYIQDEYDNQFNYFYIKIQNHLKTSNLHIKEQNRIIEDKKYKNHWLDKQIGFLIDNLNIDDTLVIYSLTHLARSPFQVYQVFNLLHQKKITLHVVETNSIVNFSKNMETKFLLKLCSQTEDSFISRRTTDAQKRKNKSTKKSVQTYIDKNTRAILEKHKKDISEYLDMNLSKIAIAKLISCPAKALNEWIKEETEEVI